MFLFIEYDCPNTLLHICFYVLHHKVLKALYSKLRAWKVKSDFCKINLNITAQHDFNEVLELLRSQLVVNSHYEGVKYF